MKLRVRGSYGLLCEGLARHQRAWAKTGPGKREVRLVKSDMGLHGMPSRAPSAWDRLFAGAISAHQGGFNRFYPGALERKAALEDTHGGALLGDDVNVGAAQDAHGAAQMSAHC